MKEHSFFSENASPKYQMFSEICDVKCMAHKPFCNPEILHFVLADIALSITRKELNTAQVTKLNKLFKLFKSIFI